MDDPVAHAKSYPFPAPDHCFLYEDGGWRRLPAGPVDRAGRVPVLAAGSNRSPAQLARKYGHIAGIGAIPAQRGRLHDFDVVYAAHLARYGSVPATFQGSPGTEVTVFVLWLTEAQLARMHETEGNYSYDRLDDVRIDLDSGGTLWDAFAYGSKIGCLGYEDGCIALAEIAAVNRRFPAMGQADVLALIRDRLAPGAALDCFIAEHAGEHAVLLERSARLAAGAVALSYRRRILQAL